MLKTKFIAGRLVVALALLAFVACGSSDNESASEADDEQLAMTEQETDTPTDEQIVAEEITPPPPAEAKEEPKAEVKPKAEAEVKPKAEAKPKPKPPAETKKEEPPPAPEPVMVTVPTGAALAVALDIKLRTDSNAVGDPIAATLASAIMAEGETAIPAGSKLHGQLTKVEEPHRSEGRAQMTLLFDKVVTPDGRTYALATAPIALEAEGDKISDEAKVAGGAGIGGAIGAIASKKKTKGAVIGGVIGAVAGGAAALATKGKQLELAAGHPLTVEVTQATQVEVPQ